MENAADAIKIIGAVFIFMICISVTIYMFSKTRKTSTEIMENSGLQSYYNIEETTDKFGNKVNILSNRIVGIETIIPTLYSYYSSNTTILFYKGEGYSVDDKGNQTFSKIEPITLYHTEALDNFLEKSSIAIKSGNKNTDKIYGLDITDEKTRQEPWTADKKHNTIFLENLINKTNPKSYESQEYYTSRKSGKNNNYYVRGNWRNWYYCIDFKYNFNNKPLYKCFNEKFLERIGNYNYTAIYKNNNTDEYKYNVTNQVDSKINFDNGESLENEEGNQKKIIQYIYIEK